MHTSATVSESPSLHELPALPLQGTPTPHSAIFACRQVPASQVSVVHASPSSQAIAVPTQPAAAQRSSTVHASPSSQAAPGVCSNAQVPAAQASLVQESPSSQTMPAPAHAPARQASPVVHGSSSVQGAPSAEATMTQAPVESHAAASQGPARLPPQSFGVCTQPISGWQASTVHGSPSAQSPAAAVTNWHPWPGTHRSLVHASESSQGSAPPPTHAPRAQASPVVHGSPSLQTAPLIGVCAQVPD
jgi:hypothetical protein